MFRLSKFKESRLITRLDPTVNNDDSRFLIDFHSFIHQPQSSLSASVHYYHQPIINFITKEQRRQAF